MAANFFKGYEVDIDDLVARVQEAIEAFKKARKDNQQPKPPSQPSQSNPGQPKDNQLIDMIAELKMTTAMNSMRK